METTGKRKEAPNDRNGGPAFKKKKGGNAGRWKTPHQQQKAVAPRFGTIEPGDTGIWATCARHMEGRAAGELRMLFDEYALKIYGINTQEDARAEDEDEDEGEDADIESSIRKEIGTLKAPKKDSTDQVFTEIRVKDDCLLFIRAKTPVKPVEFVKRICEDIKSSADGATKKTRYINRLTPITVMGKATASGVEEVARQVLPDHFTLRPAEQESQAGETRDSQGPEASPAHSYAIRTSLRNHNALNRDDVINRIASLIDPRHKVNLGSPDKVILVDIYQIACGMSVVDGDWNELKKYNLTELYSQAAKNSPPAKKDEAVTATKGES